MKAVEATEIRRRMAAGENWQELVPAAVARYMAARKL
jgi:nicotinic acid mononucleotide adenylyltransferase